MYARIVLCQQSAKIAVRAIDRQSIVDTLLIELCNN